jgi:hypothetical protein
MGRISIITKIKASDSVEDDPIYRRGYLVDAEKVGFGEARAQIEDKQTGDTEYVNVKNVSAMLGAHSNYVSDEFQEQFSATSGDKNPGNYPHEILLELLDTRVRNSNISDLTFYYNNDVASVKK